MGFKGLKQNLKYELTYIMKIIIGPKYILLRGG